MEKEKLLCEYLSEIGILLFDNINTFLNIYSENNSKKFKSEQEKQKNALFIYLQETLKNDQYLNSISDNIIETFYNKQAIIRYNALKNLVNILTFKLVSNYNFFIARIISHIVVIIYLGFRLDIIFILILAYYIIPVIKSSSNYSLKNVFLLLPSVSFD